MLFFKFSLNFKGESKIQYLSTVSKFCPLYYIKFFHTLQGLLTIYKNERRMTYD